MGEGQCVEVISTPTIRAQHIFYVMGIEKREFVRHFSRYLTPGVYTITLKGKPIYTVTVELSDKNSTLSDKTEDSVRQIISKAAKRIESNIVHNPRSDMAEIKERFVSAPRPTNLMEPVYERIVE